MYMYVYICIFYNILILALSKFCFVVVFKAQPMYAFGDLFAWLIAYGEFLGNWFEICLFYYCFWGFFDIFGWHQRQKSYKIQEFRSVHLFFFFDKLYFIVIVLSTSGLSSRSNPSGQINYDVGFQGAKKVKYWTMRDLDWAGLSKQFCVLLHTPTAEHHRKYSVVPDVW